MNFMRKLVASPSSVQNQGESSSHRSGPRTTQHTSEQSVQNAPDDETLAVNHIRKLFSELRATQSTRDAQRDPSFNASSELLYAILPLFCKVFENTSSSEMVDKFPDLHAFASFLSRFTVHEIKKLATLEQTEKAAIAVAEFLLPPSVVQTDSCSEVRQQSNQGWLLLCALNILVSAGPAGVAEQFAKANLPSTFVKVIYIFLELQWPPQADEEAPISSEEENRLSSLHTILRKILLNLSIHPSSVEEIRQKSDFRRLFEALASKAKPSAYRWKKMAFEVLLSIAKNGLNFALVEHISNQKCIAKCLVLIRNCPRERVMDVADTLIVLFHYVLRSSEISPRLLDAFRTCNGYTVATSALLSLEKDIGSAEHLEALLHLVYLIGQLTSCGPLELNPKDSTLNDQLYMIQGFEVPKPRGKGESVRNIPAFRVLQTTFLKAESERLCSAILETIQTIYHQDRANYFILEQEKTISTLAEKIYTKPTAVQDKFFELIESLVLLLKYVPMKEISSLTILMKMCESQDTQVRCVSCLLRLINIDPIFREVYRDVGILELTFEQLQIYAKKIRETENCSNEMDDETETDDWRTLGHLILRLMTSMIVSQPKTADVLREQGGVRCLLSLLPYARARPGVLQVFRELLRLSPTVNHHSPALLMQSKTKFIASREINNVNVKIGAVCDADLASLITTVFGCSIVDAAKVGADPQQALMMKIDVLRCLCGVLRESHRCRTAFRKCEGYTELMKELQAMHFSLLFSCPIFNEKTNNSSCSNTNGTSNNTNHSILYFMSSFANVHPFPTHSQHLQLTAWSVIGSEGVLSLFKAIMMMLSFSMRYEPANADYFTTQIRYSSLTEQLRCLGCFNPKVNKVERFTHKLLQQLPTTMTTTTTTATLQEENIEKELSFIVNSDAYIKYFYTLQQDENNELPQCLLNAIVVARCLYEVAFDAFDRSLTGVRFASTSSATTDATTTTATTSAVEMYNNTSMESETSQRRGSYSFSYQLPNWCLGPLRMPWPLESAGTLNDDSLSAPQDPRVNLNLVHPGAITCLLHLIPSIAVTFSTPPNDLTPAQRFHAWFHQTSCQLALLRILLSLLHKQRICQILSQEFMLNSLLNHFCEALENNQHPLHAVVAQMFIVLAKQYIRGKDLKSFLRLTFPLCCQPVRIPKKLIGSIMDSSVNTINQLYQSRRQGTFYKNPPTEDNNSLNNTITLTYLGQPLSLQVLQILASIISGMAPDIFGQGQHTESLCLPPSTCAKTYLSHRGQYAGKPPPCFVASSSVPLRRSNTSTISTSSTSGAGGGGGSGGGGGGSGQRLRRQRFGMLLSPMEGKPFVGEDQQNAFVEMDMSQEGFGCLFLPSIAPQHGGGAVAAMATMGFGSQPLDHNIVGGVGQGERIFPPTGGFTYSTWFNIQRPSFSRGPPACDISSTLSSSSKVNTAFMNTNLTNSAHPIRLLTLIRGIPATHEQLICFSILLIHATPNNSLDAFDTSNNQPAYLLISTTERLLSEEKADGSMDKISSDTTIRFPLPGDLCQLGLWNHLCLVFHRASMMKHSSITLYLNGISLGNQKLNYIAASGSSSSSISISSVTGNSSALGGGANNLTSLTNSVYAFIGTPPCLRRASSLIWRQGSFQMIEDTLTSNHIQLIHLLGPSYVGSFQACPLDNGNVASPLFPEEKLIFSIFPHNLSQMTVGRIRKVYNSADGKAIAKQLQMSGKDNSTPLRLLHNAALHLSGSARSFGAVLIGYQGVRIFTPQPLLCSLVRCVSGAVGSFLGLIAMSRSTDNLLASLQILWSTLRPSGFHNENHSRSGVLEILAQFEMGRGWQMLNMLLKHKRKYFSLAILRMCQRLAGTSETERDIGCVPLRPAFEHLLCDLLLWLPTQCDGSKNDICIQQDSASLNHSHVDIMETCCPQKSQQEDEQEKMDNGKVDATINNFSSSTNLLNFVGQSDLDCMDYSLFHELLMHLFVLLAEAQSVRRAAKANIDAQATASGREMSDNPNVSGLPINSTSANPNATIISWTKNAGLDPSYDNLVVMLECDLVGQLCQLLFHLATTNTKHYCPQSTTTTNTTNTTTTMDESLQMADQLDGSLATAGVTWAKLVTTVNDLLKVLLENIPRSEDLRRFGQFLVWTLPQLGVSESHITLAHKSLREFTDDEVAAPAVRLILLRNMGIQLLVDLLQVYGPINIRVCDAYQQILGFDWLMLFLQDNIHESTVIVTSLLLIQMLSHGPSLQKFREGNASVVGGWLQETNVVLTRQHGLKLLHESTREQGGLTQLREINVDACRLSGFIWLQHLLPHHAHIPELYFLLMALLFGKKVRQLPDNIKLEFEGLYNMIFGDATGTFGMGMSAAAATTGGGAAPSSDNNYRRSYPQASSSQAGHNINTPTPQPTLCPEAAHITLHMLSRILCLRSSMPMMMESSDLNKEENCNWICDYPVTMIRFYHTLYQTNNDFQAMAFHSDFISALTQLLVTHPGCTRLMNDSVTWSSLTVYDDNSSEIGINNGEPQTEVDNNSQLIQINQEKPPTEVEDLYEMHQCKRYVWDLLKTIVSDSLAFPLSSKQDPVIDIIIDCASDLSECGNGKKDAKINQTQPFLRRNVKNLSVTIPQSNFSTLKSELLSHENGKNNTHHRWFVTRVLQEIMEHFLAVEVMNDSPHCPTGGHAVHIPAQVAYIASRYVDKLWQGQYLGKVKEVISFVGRLLNQTRKRQASLAPLTSSSNNTIHGSMHAVLSACQDTLYRSLNRLTLYCLSRPLRNNDDCTSLCNLLSRMCAPQASISWLHSRSQLFVSSNTDMDFLIGLLHLLIQLVLGHTNQFAVMASERRLSTARLGAQEWEGGDAVLLAQNSSSDPTSPGTPDMKSMKAIRQAANKLWEEFFNCRPQAVDEIFTASGFSLMSFNVNLQQSPTPPPLSSLLVPQLEEYCLRVWNQYMEQEALPGGCTYYTLHSFSSLTSPYDGASNTVPPTPGGSFSNLSLSNSSSRVTRWGRIVTTDGGPGSINIPGSGNSGTSGGATEKISQHLSRLTRMGSGMLKLASSSSSSASSSSTSSSSQANKTTTNQLRKSGISLSQSGASANNSSQTMPFEEARLWIPPHVSVVKELIYYQSKQYYMKSNYLQRYLTSQWLLWEKELTRERGLWGPLNNQAASILDKWQLDSSEGPCRMRKNLIPNDHFYEHYPYQPPISKLTLDSEGTTIRTIERPASKYRAPASYHSRLQYFFHRPRSLLFAEEEERRHSDRDSYIKFDDIPAETSTNDINKSPTNKSSFLHQQQISSTVVTLPGGLVGEDDVASSVVAAVASAASDGNDSILLTSSTGGHESCGLVDVVVAQTGGGGSVVDAPGVNPGDGGDAKCVQQISLDVVASDSDDNAQAEMVLRRTEDLLRAVARSHVIQTNDECNFYPLNETLDEDTTSLRSECGDNPSAPSLLSNNLSQQQQQQHNRPQSICANSELFSLPEEPELDDKINNDENESVSDQQSINASPLQEDQRSSQMEAAVNNDQKGNRVSVSSVDLKETSSPKQSILSPDASSSSSTPVGSSGGVCGSASVASASAAAVASGNKTGIQRQTSFSNVTGLPPPQHQVHEQQRMHQLQQQTAINQLIESGDKIEFLFRCARVSGLDVHEGILLFGKEHFYLIEGFTLVASLEMVDIDTLPTHMHEPIVPRVTSSDTKSTSQSSERQHFKFLYDDVREIHQRRYILQPIAVEVFNVDGRNFLLVFPKNMMLQIYNKFTQKCCVALAVPHLSSSKQKGNKNGMDSGSLLSNWIGEKSVTKKWERGEINNFTYLMHLNTMAGRSYNDLMQYPIFPWILADYESDELNLNQPQTFRDLSLPMGAQTEARRRQFEARFREFNDPSAEEQPAYHYATHYSSAMIVAAYLIRMEPFTQYFLRLQGGYFDLADRMFHSVRDAWYSASKHNMADVKELIPEFFYLPNFLVNSNAFDLGQKQSGVVLNDVVLPPWAKGDPREFIRAHREALECDYVSAHLHEWIDLIFGSKQRGESALQACNVFHYLFYEGSVNIYDIQDPVERAAVIGFINNFGQIPTQLFRKPHPQKRMTIPRGPAMIMNTAVFRQSNLTGAEKLFFYNLDSMRPSMQPIKELRSPVGQIVPLDHQSGLTSGKPSAVLAVERNRCLLVWTGNLGIIPGVAGIGCLNASGGPSTGGGHQSSGLVGVSGTSSVSATSAAAATVASVGSSVGAASGGISLSSVRSLAWGYHDASMRLLSGEAGDRCLRVVEMVDAPWPVNCVVMVTDRLIATGGASAVLRIWELQLNPRFSSSSASVNSSIPGSLGSSSSSSTSGSGGVVDFGSGPGSSSTSLAGPLLRHRCNLFGHNDDITCITACASFGILVSGSRDGVCIQWDLSRLCFLRQLYYTCSTTTTTSAINNSSNISFNSRSASLSAVTAICIHESTGDIAVATGSWLHVFTVSGQLLASVNTATCSNIPLLYPLSMANYETNSSSHKSNQPSNAYLQQQREKRVNAIAFSTLLDWDANSVIVTGSNDGVVRMWTLDYVRVPVLDDKDTEEDEEDNHNSQDDDEEGSPSHQRKVSDSSKTPLLQRGVTLCERNDEDGEGNEDGVDEDDEDDAEEDSEEKKSDDDNVLSTPTPTALTSTDPIESTSPAYEEVDDDFILVTTPISAGPSSKLSAFDRLGGTATPATDPLADKNFRWQRQLLFRSKLTMHTAFERSDNPHPAPITALAVSRDHRVLYVGDSRGRVFCWTVPSDVSGRGGPADHWVRDEGSDFCAGQGCQIRFSLTERRHHCRNCGQVFCSKCSNYESVIYHRRVFKPVRVCAQCYRELAKYNESIGFRRN